MFKPAADMLSWADTEMPAPSYEGGFTKWKEVAESAVAELVGASDVPLSQVEEDGLDIATQIGHGILEKFLAHSTAAGWSSQTVEERISAVEDLLNAPHTPQRTPEWYVQGKCILTASEFANLYGSPRAIRMLAQQKATPSDGLTQQTNRLACMTCEMGPFDWGIRFEPVVKQILERTWGAKVVDSGRIVHTTDPKLAASPDGFIMAAIDPARIGRLLEIKCPITREIGGNIPYEYWCQMQIQMEVTGIDECEYVEVKLDSPSAKQPTPSDTVPDGLVWLYQDTATYRMGYAYTEEEKVAFEKRGCDLIETIPWRLVKLYTKTVTRDRAWFRGTQQMRDDFWNLVDKIRKGEVAPLEVKVRNTGPAVVTVTKVCRMIDDDPIQAESSSLSPLGQDV